MPRFEPTVAAAFPELIATLIKAAFDDIKIDEPRLVPNNKMNLTRIRQLRANGLSRKEVTTQLSLSRPDADEVIAAALREAIDKVDVAKARVLCFATEFDNEPMWAHYADDLKGCVLGFKNIPPLNLPLFAAKPVEYPALPPIIGPGLDFLLYGDTPDLRKKTFEAVCFSKKADWSYEREWRIVYWANNAGNVPYNDEKFHPEELESVTLGPDTTTESEKRIRELLKAGYPKCSLFRFAVNNGVASRVKA